MRRCDYHVEDLQHLVGKVERAVLEDVDLDALQQGQAVDFLLNLCHLLRLREQADGVETVDDLDPRRVVGDAQVAIAERPGGFGHLEHGGAAVAPGRVRVEVALVFRQVDVGLVVSGWLPRVGPQPVEVAAAAGRYQVREHLGDAGADARDGRQVVVLVQRFDVRPLEGDRPRRG